MNLQNLITYSSDVLGVNVWAGVALPDGLSSELCINEIVMRCGLQEPVYAEPLTFKEMVTHWFLTHGYYFEHLKKIVLAEYSPIENTDRYETRTDTGSGSTVHGGVDSETGTISFDEATGETEGGTDSFHRGRNTTDHTTELLDEDTTLSHGDITEHTISAFDSSSYQPDNKTEVDVDDTGTKDSSLQRSGSGTEEIDDSTNYGKTLNGTKTGSDTTDKRFVHGHTETKEESGSYDLHTHGNIGVTSNQELQQQEIDWLIRFGSVYKQIAMLFEADFMICLY